MEVLNIGVIMFGTRISRRLAMWTLGCGAVIFLTLSTLTFYLEKVNLIAEFEKTITQLGEVATPP